MSTTFAQPVTDPVTAAYERIRAAYTADLNAQPVTVPDGYELERIGQCWTVGPTGTGTHLLVDELWKVPGAIAVFEQQLHRAARIGATL